MKIENLGETVKLTFVREKTKLTAVEDGVGVQMENCLIFTPSEGESYAPKEFTDGKHILDKGMYVSIDCTETINDTVVLLCSSADFNKLVLNDL